MLFGWISSWLHIITRALPWAYELSRFTQPRYISETTDAAEGQTENLNPSYSWPLVCSVVSFTLPLTWSTCNSFAIAHCFGTQQKRESLANAHTNALVLQQWTLKQPFSFSVCPSRLHICKDTLMPNKCAVHFTGIFSRAALGQAPCDAGFCDTSEIHTSLLPLLLCQILLNSQVDPNFMGQG